MYNFLKNMKLFSLDDLADDMSENRDIVEKLLDIAESQFVQECCRWLLLLHKDWELELSDQDNERISHILRNAIYSEQGSSRSLTLLRASSDQDSLFDIQETIESHKTYLGTLPDLEVDEIMWHYLWSVCLTRKVRTSALQIMFLLWESSRLE